MCYVMHIGTCTKKATDCHHLMNGSSVYRKRCDKYGLVIPVCRQCHERLHNDKAMLIRYKKLAQKAFEKQNTREEWLNLFHKNYLED